MPRVQPSGVGDLITILVFPFRLSFPIDIKTSRKATILLPRRLLLVSEHIGRTSSVILTLSINQTITMHIFPAIILISSASAVVASLIGQHLSMRALTGLYERQPQMCQLVPAPLTCEKSCGPGYVTCVNLPNCFNPSIGETCCSDGSPLSLALKN